MSSGDIEIDQWHKMGYDWLLEPLFSETFFKEKPLCGLTNLRADLKSF